EGAEAARSTATGMAAMTSAMLSIVKAGDHVVSSKTLFGSCRVFIENILSKFGVDCTLVDGDDNEAWKKAFRPNPTAVFLESPANPTLDVVDIQFVCDVAHENGALVVVDNVFATPLLQKPMQMGADIVIYSSTKHIDGQGRALGGVILGSKELIEGDVHTIIRQTGPSISPFNAWIMLKGLETLDLRVRKMSENAAKIADFLAEHSKVATLFYPHHQSHPQYDLGKQQMNAGSNLVAFEVKGNKQAAFECADGLGIFLISNNLGDAKSIISHPATTTHQRFDEATLEELGIKQNLLRLSVGLEDVDDLIGDLAFGLDQV
ncbi:MAG: aminotransferase class V-fold PLP-dependent enzyme, partial [Devosiaceae bacterium]|nr:aminotransferase class V-fold PLP-dependent enzyme [Devosiaceae bacterium]